MPPTTVNQSAANANTVGQAAATPFGKSLKGRDLAPLINFLTICRSDPKWVFFHASVVENSRSNLGEVIQMLEYNLGSVNSLIIRMDDSQETLILCNSASSRKFATVDNEIAAALQDQNVPMHSDTLCEKGVSYLEKILSPYIEKNDDAARIALRRFVRLGNMFMVLDDDPVVLKQMEHMLKGYGYVELHNNVRDFLSAYKKYAPNAVFLDIHIRHEKGMDVASTLVEKIDPGAHIVMISADAVKANVVESRGRGAKGFIGKPVNMEMVMRNLMTVPTLYSKK